MQAHENVFGANAKIHPVTGMPLESGIGAQPEHVQAAMHVATLEPTIGKEAADAMRRKLGLPVAEDIAAAKAKAEAERIEREKAAVDAAKVAAHAHSRIDDLEKLVHDLEEQLAAALRPRGMETSQ